MSETTSEFAPLPADDLSRGLALAQLDSPAARHIGLVGDTYLQFAQVVRLGVERRAILFLHDNLRVWNCSAERVQDMPVDSRLLTVRNRGTRYK